MASGSIALLVKNALLREGLGRLLADNDFEIVQSIDSAEDLNFDFDTHNHILIMDYAVEGKSSLKDTIPIISKFAQSKCVILADKFDFATMRKIFLAGANGYILNEVPYKTFLAMIQLISMGESIFPSQFKEIIHQIDIKNKHSTNDNIVSDEISLSDRDIKILDGLSLGLSNKMISRELEISEASVKVAMKAIFRKLSVHNRTQAAILAREIDLLSLHRAPVLLSDGSRRPPLRARVREPRSPVGSGGAQAQPRAIEGGKHAT
jgi:two-component system nitrate/nitrite response regulator NarL